MSALVDLYSHSKQYKSHMCTLEKALSFSCNVSAQHRYVQQTQIDIE